MKRALITLFCLMAVLTLYIGVMSVIATWGDVSPTPGPLHRTTIYFTWTN